MKKYILVLIIVLVFSCSIKKTEQVKDAIKDKSELNSQIDYQGSSFGNVSNYNSIMLDTSSSEGVIFILTEFEKRIDSIGKDIIKVKQIKIEKNKTKNGFNQTLNADKTIFKQDSLMSAKTNIKNDIDKTLKTKETNASNSKWWYNLLWLLIPLAVFIYLRYFRG